LFPRVDDRLRCLIRDEVRRATRLFDSGWQVWDSLHVDGKPMFSMMWRTYRQLLERIAEDPAAVATRRVRLTFGEQLGLVSRHFVGPLFQRLEVPPRELGA
jgi:phytoene synthase